MSSTTSRQSDTRALRLALGAYVIVLALKLAAYFATGLLVMLAEALHTLPVREASRIADEVRRRLHDSADPGYCVIEIDAGLAQPA